MHVYIHVYIVLKSLFCGPFLCCTTCTIVEGILPQMLGENSITFFIVHVVMLCGKFKLIPIKIYFFL